MHNWCRSMVKGGVGLHRGINIGDEGVAGDTITRREVHEGDEENLELLIRSIGYWSWSLWTLVIWKTILSSEFSIALWWSSRQFWSIFAGGQVQTTTCQLIKIDDCQSRLLIRCYQVAYWFSRCSRASVPVARVFFTHCTENTCGTCTRVHPCTAHRTVSRV